MPDSTAASPFDRAPLGRTDVLVTRMGLGTAPLGGWPTAVTRADGIATVRRAWEWGIRYFDVAPFYGSGLSEGFLGAVLPEKPRDAFALSTKVGRLLVPGEPAESLYEGGLPFTPVIDFSRAGVVQSLAESRQRLGLERIDIALIHDPDDYLEDALAESYPALAELRAAGVLGAIGAGMNWSEPLTRLAESADFDCFLLAGRYTLLEQGPLDNLFPVAKEKSMAIIAGGVYNSGLLIDPRPGATYDYAPADDAVIARARRIRDVCARYDVPIGAAAVQFPLAHPVVATVLVGARSAGEVDRSVELMTWEIPGELWLSLKEDELLREDAPTP